MPSPNINEIVSYSFLRKLVSSEVADIISGTEQRFSYLLEGDHGIGKSAFWKELCIDFDGFIIDMRLGQRDLGDIIGMPVVVGRENNNEHFIHILPEIIRPAFVKDLSELGVIGKSVYQDKLIDLRPKECLGKPFQFVLLFLDEYNRGTKDVQQSVFEIVYDRSMNGNRVNPKTLIAAACNGNLEIYTVTESDPAFRSRFKTFYYKPTWQEWLEWGKKKNELCEDVQYVISVSGNGVLADPPIDKEKQNTEYLNQPHPNRRSWHEFSKWYEKNLTKFTLLEIKQVCMGYVGVKAAEVFSKVVKEKNTIKEERKHSVETESAKVTEFYANYFVQSSNWSHSEAEKKLIELNTNELNALAEVCIARFNKLKFISNKTMVNITNFLKKAPEEIVTSIWSNISSEFKLKERIKLYFEDKGDKDFIAKLDKIQ